ncbi:MAG: SDR family oxidoreductase [Rhodospirillales bacterium]|nr:MAG: SDR family oxidoreductase [Rhodospirillales bacterium]
MGEAGIGRSGGPAPAARGSSRSEPSMRLNGKVAVVAGAGRGIGAAIARRFAAEGAAVVVADAAAGAVVAAAIVESGGRAVHVAGDVTSAAGARALVAAAGREFGRMDVFVLGDGAAAWGRAAVDVSDDELDRLLTAGLRGLRHAVRACVPAWEAAGGGVMIVLASSAGLRPRAGFVWPAAASAAAIAAVKALAVEYGPKGLRFNALCAEAAEAMPMATSMPAPIGAAEAGAAVVPPVRFAGGTPLGRAGRASDAAEAAVFLASDESAFITGAVLPVDGGGSV